MTLESIHAGIESLLGAYALDAAISEEAEAISRHLRGCPRCCAEVGEHRQVAALLANAGGSAPAGVWDRISAQLDETPPAFDRARIMPIRDAKPLGRRVAAVALTAAALIIGILGTEVGRLDRRVAVLQRPSQGVGVQQAALAALLDPAAQQIELRSDRSPDDVHIAILPGGQGYVVKATLPALKPSQTYELWALVDGRTKIPLGLLGHHPYVTAFRVDPAQVTRLAVTAEPVGGVFATDKPSLVWGIVPSIT